MRTPEKKYRRIWLFITILSAILLTRCSSNKNEQEKTSEEKKDIKLKFETTIFEKSQKGCDESECARLIVSYPVFEPGHKLNESINEALNQKINLILTDLVLDASKNQSIDELADLFVEGYQKFKLEFPESRTGWYIRQNISVIYTGKTFVSIQVDTESYTGGAHPLSNRQFLNIDMEGSTLDSYDQFVISIPKLTDLAEDRFRQEMKIKPDQSLSDAGFLFENGIFSLPENVGFSKNGMILYYNSYEVADYATGPIEIIIPFNQLKGIYRHKAL